MSFLNPAVALALYVSVAVYSVAVYSVAVYYAFERLPVGQRAGGHLG